VLTLGLIGSWQVFDQIYTGTKGAPGKTTLTPAFLSYQSAFNNQEWGQGAAIAFILFVIIVFFTLFQRWVLRERSVSNRRMRPYLSAANGATATVVAASALTGAGSGSPGTDSPGSGSDPDSHAPDTTGGTR